MMTGTTAGEGDRRVNVKLTADTSEYIEEMRRATEVTQAFRKVSRILREESTQEIRGHDPHRFPETTATDPDYEFTVEALPKRDLAQTALNEARDRYFRQYPDAKPNELIWTIRAEKRKDEE